MGKLFRLHCSTASLDREISLSCFFILFLKKKNSKKKAYLKAPELRVAYK